MTYATTNPPQAIVAVPTVGGSTFTLWFYSSTDNGAAVDADGYFTNGQSLGMKAGDLVIVQDSDDYATTMHVVLSLSTSDDSVDLGNGTTIGTTTDSD